LQAKRYFSLVDVEQYDWSTKELVQSAEEVVHGLEEELRWNSKLILLFIPLADFDSSGAYHLTRDRACLVAEAGGSLDWHNHPKESAFRHFEEEALHASNTFRSYLVRLLSYALAHGMDVAKLNREGSGRSILHPLPHSELHADVGGYDG
jgi:hypothetical protein